MDIWKAVVDGPIQRVKKIFNSQRIDVNEQDPTGNTLLMYACKFNQFEIAKFLIGKGANPNIVGEFEHTALIDADDIRIFKLLLDHRANINAQDDLGDTRLIQSSRVGPSEHTKYLLLRGANPNIQNDIGYTALMFAAEIGFADIVELLIDFGANVTITNYDEQTVFDVADGFMKKIILNKLIQKNIPKRKILELVRGQKLPTDVYKQIGEFLFSRRKYSRH